MRFEWASKRLGDCCLKIGSGATPKGGKDVYLENGPFKLIRSQNIYNTGFTPSGIAYIDEIQAQKLDNTAVEVDDVLLNITGDSVARVCQAPAEFMPARVNQHVAIIRPSSKVFDARFLRYFLASPKQQDYMLGLAAAGATRNALTKKMIEDFLVPCPSISVQAAIGAALGALDTRITLLRETNATLEAIAQTLFKSWFVDFDPVRAKMEGREPDGMDEALAALFPNRFEESELGPMPAGWHPVALADIATFLNGLALQKFPPSGLDDLPVIKIAQLRKGNSVGAELASRSIKAEYIVQNGDVLFSWSGSLEVEIWCGGEGALNQHLFKVTSDRYPKWFYYLWTRYHLEYFRQIAASKATTMGHIQRAHLSVAKVVVPSAGVLDSATEILQPIIDRIIENTVTEGALGKLRDALLPRLISGQIRLPETMEILEAA